MSSQPPVSPLSAASSLLRPQFQYRGHDVLDLLKAARNYNEWLTEQVVAGMPTNARRVVDLGAGCGTFSELLRARGVEVECVEPDCDNQRELRRLGFAVRDDLHQLDPESVDYIFALNVVEHVREDQALAAAAFSRLGRGGHFLVFVPAFPLLWSRLDDHVQHERRYRRGLLLKMLRRVGFTVQRARYVDSIGFFAALAARLSNSEVSMRNVAFYDQLLVPMSIRLDPFLGRFMGKNLAVLCLRP